ncbi:TatD family hydrolase [Campylobacter geochelonis]|uniref:Putative deoxyribonuclease Sll1786 n=1 Tax=Campylobacter geochelonis TaxID=1780362 RepID=A0A128ERF7_9BACT|nr:TatD family hydrolase [Campylobacter geochelonis]QKF71681.1 ssDNA/RNA exonuclease, 3' - 5' specific [Campylobacter geochelonis]CZE49232.1 putative deoxyribonuclease Sll1786 [Campylobacter geochelonis]CZE49250.1 putative deoxyribonuclease Sll1786 [Campylobacter geochelonis]CZE51299.1 putative deoxyribonuclease Sll1786 [Campylobacter geochelonis]
MIIDTHCHLDDESFSKDLEEVIIRARENGIQNIIIPGADMNDLKKAREISYSYDDVYFASGVHPYHCHDFDISYLKHVAEDKRCVAIGECGLDYYRLKSDFATKEEQEAEKKLQKEVFIAQINLAKELKKPLIVHIRDANQDSFDILKQHANELVGGVLHCYNSSELLLELKDSGFYFGIGGVLTFKNAKSLVEILPKIPLSNLLIETDAPYLSPEPNRGKRNEPSYTKFVVEKVSNLLNLNISEVEKITTDNAKKLFKI